MKKYGQTSDVASQIAVLSSRVVSGHISGEVIMVNGGMEGKSSINQTSIPCQFLINSGRLLNLREDMEA